MQFRHVSCSLIAIASLTACSGGGGGGGGGNPDLEVINEDGVVLSASGSGVTLTNNDGEVTLDLDGDFDRGTFDGASDLDAGGEGQILAFSEGASTFATFLLTRDSGASADVSFGRSAASGPLPSGGATLTGTYVGAFIEDPDITRSYIQGDASLTVDLDDMLISGSVTNLTSELLGSGTQEPLGETANIVLPEADILSNGTFSAAADRDIPDPDGEQQTTVSTDWSGLLGGDTLADLEAVGRIDVVTETVLSGGGTATETQSGAFVVGHE